LAHEKIISPLKKARQANQRWVLLRKWVQGIFFAVFILLVIMSHRGGWPAGSVNLFMRLDPLIFQANIISARTLLAGSAVVAFTILLTLATGRSWCGWICPLGSLLDWITPGYKQTAGKKVPEKLRGIKYFLLALILVTAVFGNLTFMVLDPITILYRTVTVSIWPGLDRLVTAGETALNQASFLSPTITAFDTWLRPAVLPISPVFYRGSLLFLGLFIGILALNWWMPRFWCRYLCPLGGLLGLISKFSIFRREVGEACRDCGICSSRCPTGTIDPTRNFSSDPSECTLCLECLESCPKATIQLNARYKPAEWREYDPGRRTLLGAIGSAAMGVAVIRSEPASLRKNPHLLRPPGAKESTLLNTCVRCGACMRACPTSGLQPSLAEAGIEGVSTPILIPRLGYCDYSCNACGQVCPVSAIPSLTLDEKRQTVIGKAYIDQNRCIAWSDHIDCIVCEEMCPVPEKAIQLKEMSAEGPDGTEVTVKVPHVLRDRCIGCGICEFKCPVNSQAAIRVYVENFEDTF
jgi:polyferredoxin